MHSHAPLSVAERISAWGKMPPVPQPSTRGRLLVATPPLVDPHFDRTVVYMLEHHHEGALGVVLNRPIESPSIPVLGLGAWEAAMAEPTTVFSGGPVSPEALIAVGHRSSGASTDHDEGWGGVSDGVGTVDISLQPEEFDPPVDALRLFAGYSGWAPGQLDAELAAHAWIVVSAEPNDVFTSEPSQLWRAVLARQGGRVAWLAHAPADLSAN
jgi:putative transcriptional regulator